MPLQVNDDNIFVFGNRAYLVLLNNPHDLVCRIEIEDSEAVGISSIISNLITVFPRNVLTAIPSELFSSFVNCLTHLTCSFGRSAALEEVVSGCAKICLCLVVIGNLCYL